MPPPDSADPAPPLSFSLTRDDLAALARLRRGGALEFDLKWFLAAAMLAGAGAALAEDRLDPASYGPIAVGVLVFAAVMALGAGFRRWRNARAAARWPLPARTQVVATPHGLALDEDGRARLLAWDAVGALRADDERLTLIGPKPESWAILPARAFADPQAMAAFRRVIEARLDEDDAREAQDASERDENERAGNARETASEAAAPPRGSLGVATRIEAQDARRVLSAPGERVSYALAFGLAALIGAALFGAIAFLLAPMVARAPAADGVWLWGALAGAMLGALALGLKFDRVEARRWADWRAQDARLAIDADGLTRSADGVVARFAWRRVDRIETTAQDLVFWMDREIVPAPRRCFASPDEFAAFAAAARAWRRAALATPPASTPAP